MRSSWQTQPPYIWISPFLPLKQAVNFAGKANLTFTRKTGYITASRAKKRKQDSRRLSIPLSPHAQKARELIQAGALGKVLTVHAHWGEYLPNWHPWEDYRQSYAARADLGGGVIVTLTHPLDYLRFIFGEVESLWSFNGHISPLELDVEDVAEIGLKFSSGAIGGVHLNYFQRPPVHRLEIVGTSWHITLGQCGWSFASFRRCLPPSVHILTSRLLLFLKSFSPPEGFERNQLFIAQTKHFIDVAHGEAQPICDLTDGVRALQMALAAYKSQKTEKSVRLSG